MDQVFSVSDKPFRNFQIYQQVEECLTSNMNHDNLILYLSFLTYCIIPRQSRTCKIMAWIKFMKIMIISHCLKVRCVPNILYMFALIVRYVLITQNTVKFIFCHQLFFIEFIKTTHLVMWINSFLFHELECFTFKDF